MNHIGMNMIIISSVTSSWQRPTLYSKIDQLYPINFRWLLNKCIGEEDDKILAFYELKLIEEGWIVQKRAGHRIFPSRKLIQKFELQDHCPFNKSTIFMNNPWKPISIKG